MFLYDSIIKPIVVHPSMEYRLAVKRNKLLMYLVLMDLQRIMPNKTASPQSLHTL